MYINRSYRQKENEREKKRDADRHTTKKRDRFSWIGRWIDRERKMDPEREMHRYRWIDRGKAGKAIGCTLRMLKVEECIGLPCPTSI